MSFLDVIDELNWKISIVQGNMSLDDFIDRYTNTSSSSISIEDFIEKYKIYAYLEGEKFIRTQVIKDLREDFNYVKDGRISVEFCGVDNIYHSKIREHLTNNNWMFLENVQIDECSFDFVFTKNSILGRNSFYFIKILYTNPEYVCNWTETEEYKFAISKGWYLHIYYDFIDDYYKLHNKITKLTNTTRSYTSRM